MSRIHPVEDAPRRRAPAAIREPQWRWPLTLLAAAGAASVVMATARPPHLIVVLPAIAMYLVASRLPRRLSIVAGVAAGVLLGAPLLHDALGARTAPLLADVVDLLPLAAAWFIGDAVAARRRYDAGVAEQRGREREAEVERARREIREERVRIAHELHDVVAHSLAVITVRAGVGRRLMEKRPEEASGALESIERIGRTAQEELRVVLGLLREEGTTTAERSPAPRLADLKELVETVRTSGTGVELRLSGAERRLSPALELSLYRVVQEALTNVVRHAPGAAATVEVAVSDDTVRVEVVDGGSPAGRTAPPGPPGPPGHGLVGMRERVAAFGGSLVARPCPDGGFRVVAEVPLEGAG